MIDVIKTRECLTTQFLDNKDLHDALERAIESGNFYIDEDGSSNYSDDFIKEIHTINNKEK